MASSATRGLSERHAQAGRLGARKRWGEPRIVRLDSLTPAQRQLVLSLVEARKAAEAQGAPTPVPSA